MRRDKACIADGLRVDSRQVKDTVLSSTATGSDPIQSSESSLRLRKSGQTVKLICVYCRELMELHLHFSLFLLSWCSIIRTKVPPHKGNRNEIAWNLNILLTQRSASQRCAVPPALQCTFDLSEDGRNPLSRNLIRAIFWHRERPLHTGGPRELCHI